MITLSSIAITIRSPTIHPPMSMAGCIIISFGTAVRLEWRSATRSNCPWTRRRRATRPWRRGADCSRGEIIWVFRGTTWSRFATGSIIWAIAAFQSLDSNSLVGATSIGGSPWVAVSTTNAITEVGGGSNFDGLVGGVEKITFVKVNFDSLFNPGFAPLSYTYTVPYITNYQFARLKVKRTITAPDILYSGLISSSMRPRSTIVYSRGRARSSRPPTSLPAAALLPAPSIQPNLSHSTTPAQFTSTIIHISWITLIIWSIRFLIGERSMVRPILPLYIQKAAIWRIWNCRFSMGRA